MPSPRREKAAPWGEAALGVTTQPLNSTASPATVSSTGATLREDPLQGWFNLSKPARARQQKKSWSRKQRGFADLFTLLWILHGCSLVFVMFAAGGLI